jgi:hypothetical protein
MTITNPYWTIPINDGVQCTNLDTGETIFVLIVNIFQGTIENSFDNFDCGTNDLCVIHFSVSRNIGIFEAVNRFIAKRFNGRTGVLAACYDKGSKRDLKRVLKSTDPNNEFLRIRDRHLAIPFSVRTQQHISVGASANG